MPLIREPQFYVDECLDSDCFVEVLESAWIKVVRHRDLFEKGISDEVWMKKSSEMGYYPLTYDYKIAQSENQTKFVMDMCLGLFIIRSGRTHLQRAQLVAQNNAQILRFIKKNYRPYIAIITDTGVYGRRPTDRKWGQKYPQNG